MKDQIALIAGSLISTGSRITNRGAGIVWSGEIGLKIQPNLAKNLAKKLDEIILVVGTNGKTTTASMISHVLSSDKFPYIHNNTGANLLNGITGTLMQKYGAMLDNEKTIGIFEVDEAALPGVLSQITPNILVMLNLFRDQLDRYGEVDAVANTWKSSISKLPKDTTIVANADDPMIVSLTRDFPGRSIFFGLDHTAIDRQSLSHASDTIYCPLCGSKLVYKHVYLAHYGDWHCPKCLFKRPELNVFFAETSLKGRYNVYNALAAKTVCETFGIKEGSIRTALSSFTAAFGRQESFKIGEKTVELLLSKNPAGFNESLKTVLEQEDIGAILLALNDRTPDGTDVSWIWDVDFEQLDKHTDPVLCTGDRAYDMGLRIQYACNHQSNTEIVEPDYKKAIVKALTMTPNGKTLYILPTYSAMLDIRKELTGKKIL